MNLDFLTGFIIGTACGIALGFFVAWVIVSIRERGESKRTKGTHEK